MYIVCIVYSVGAISNQKLNKIKDENFWAQVRRQNKKPPPEGWELIEPTLEELEGKMRWAYITIFNSSQEMVEVVSVHSNCYVSQQEWLLREAETDDHEGKRKVEALWPIFKIHHQKSRWSYIIVIWMSICGFAIGCLQDNEHQKIVLTSSLAFRYLFDLYYRRKAISRELYDYCVKVDHQILTKISK